MHLSNLKENVEAYLGPLQHLIWSFQLLTNVKKKSNLDVVGVLDQPV